MYALSPLPPRHLDLLIDRTSAARKTMKRRGELRPLIVVSPEQRGDGVWREPIYITADAVIIEANDLLHARGASRAAIDAAYADIQLCIIGALNDLDDGRDICLALAHDANSFAVVTAQSTAEAFKIALDHFASRGSSEPFKLNFFAAPLREVVATVRARAAQHGIELPERLWPSLDELDAGAALIAAALGSRVSPIIEQWQQFRTAEREALTRRSQGSLS